MKFKKNKLTKTRERKIEQQHTRIAFALIIFYVTYYFLFEQKIIGHDSKYIIYIFLLPTLIGLFAIAYYRRHFLRNIFSKSKGFFSKISMFLFLFFEGLLFSYLSFGQVAKISFDILNWNTANKNSAEVIVCKITKFSTGKYSNKIDFVFKERSNQIEAKYDLIKPFLEKKTDGYYIEIKARKALWNYYYVEKWKINKK